MKSHHFDRKDREKPNIEDEEGVISQRFLIGRVHSRLKMRHQPEPQIRVMGVEALVPRTRVWDQSPPQKHLAICIPEQDQVLLGIKSREG